MKLALLFKKNFLSIVLMLANLLIYCYTVVAYGGVLVPMDPIQATAAIMTLGFVAVTHLIGFNNVRVFNSFWIPEFVLLLYVFYTIIPFEKIPNLVRKLKTRLQKSRSQRKVVKINSIWKKITLPLVFDGVLITAVASLSLYLLYRL